MSREAQLGIATYHVAAGILRDRHGRILLAERLGDSAFAGLWEFPGGKILPGERPGAALRRELDEELGVLADDIQHFLSVEHEYADRRVRLEFYLVRTWRGEPEGREGQRLRWESPDAVDPDMLLPANIRALESLR